jgi:hypothetical protein
MKNTHMIVAGLVLILIANFMPKVQSNGLIVAIVIDLCYVVGLLMFIIGAFRQYQEKKKKG